MIETDESDFGTALAILPRHATIPAYLSRPMVTTDQLLGTWKVIEDPFNQGEETFYSFTPTTVTITFETKVRTQKIFLTYELEGNVIITDQPSHPKIERAKIEVASDCLTLDYNGHITRLRKVS